MQLMPKHSKLIKANTTRTSRQKFFWQAKSIVTDVATRKQKQKKDTTTKNKNEKIAKLHELY